MVTQANATLRSELDRKAREEIAFCKGQIAACHRNEIGELVPKFSTAGESAAWERGFEDVKARLEA